MTVFSALLLAGVLSVLALAVGVAAGIRLSPRAAHRRNRASRGMDRDHRRADAATHRRADAAGGGGGGFPPRRRLPQRPGHRSWAWCATGNSTTRRGQAAQQALEWRRRRIRPAAGQTRGRAGPGYRCTDTPGCSSEEDRRFAVVFVHDQSDYARMEATRRDFVANVSHELKTPVGAMALLAEALLASADDSETVRRFAEKVLVEANRLGGHGRRADRAVPAAGRRAVAQRDRGRRRHRCVGSDFTPQGGRRQRRHRGSHRCAQRLAGTGRPNASGHRAGQPGVATRSPIRRPVRRSRSAAAAAATTSRSPSPTVASGSRWKIRSGSSSGSSAGQGTLARHWRQRAGPGHRQTCRGQPQRQHRGVEQAGHRIDVHAVDPGLQGQ